MRKPIESFEHVPHAGNVFKWGNHPFSREEKAILFALGYARSVKNKTALSGSYIRGKKKMVTWLLRPG